VGLIRRKGTMGKITKEPKRKWDNSYLDYLGQLNYKNQKEIEIDDNKYILHSISSETKYLFRKEFRYISKTAMLIYIVMKELSKKSYDKKWYNRKKEIYVQFTHRNIYNLTKIRIGNIEDALIELINSGIIKLQKEKDKKNKYYFIDLETKTLKLVE